MLEFLVEPFTFHFVRRAFVAALLAGGVSALVGTYVVLRGMAFMGDALAHSVLPGVAIAHVLDRNIFLGAFLAGVLTSAGVGYVSRRGALKEDTAIGILLSGTFALGIAILSSASSSRVDPTSFLFGNVLGVSTFDLWMTGAVGVLALATWLLFRKGWAVFAFDPVYAAAVGLPSGLLHYGLLILTSLAIVAALQTVGIIMALSMLVTPAATARLWTDRLPPMIVASVLLSAVASIVGIYTSFYMNVASGATIALTSGVLFGISFFVSPKSARTGMTGRRTGEGSWTVESKEADSGQ